VNHAREVQQVSTNRNIPIDELKRFKQLFIAPTSGMSVAAEIPRKIAEGIRPRISH